MISFDHAVVFRKTGCSYQHEIISIRVTDVANLTEEQAHARATIVLHYIMNVISPYHEPEELLELFEAYRRKAEVTITQFRVTRRELALKMRAKRIISLPLQEKKIKEAQKRRERRFSRGKRKEKKSPG